jgi:hypothetical protein
VNPVLLGVLGLIFVYLFVTLYLFLVRLLGQGKKTLLKKRLGSLNGSENDDVPRLELDILKSQQLSAMPWLNLLLERMRFQIPRRCQQDHKRKTDHCG